MKQPVLITAALSLKSHPLVPEQVGYTRAWQDLVTFYIPISATRTRVVMLMRTDLKGQIPLWVFTQTCGTTAMLVFKTIRKLCKDKR